MPTSQVIQVALQLVRIRPDELETLRCLKCGAELELDQPDIDEPSRLIATCCDCCEEGGTWHVIDQGSNDQEWLLVLLPATASLLQLAATGKSEP